jgi:DNA polymerase-1
MKHLLIDGDILAYQAALKCEHPIAEQIDDDVWYTYSVSENEILNAIKNHIDFYLDSLGGSSYTITLSDPKRNFRKHVYPLYKANRDYVKKPLGLLAALRIINTNFKCFSLPSLEGDDVLGILATSPKFVPTREKIIVSLDKDLTGIPGKYSKDGLDYIEVSVKEADTMFMVQTLTGDTVDNYPGCPGIGAVKAKALLNDAPSLKEMWELVVAQYATKGFDADYALIQARCARILRYQDYANNAPILWNPPT